MSILRALADRFDQPAARSLIIKGRRIAPIFTFVSLSLGVYFYFEEAADRHNQRLIAAWQLISTPANGNTGKISALEFLSTANRPLVGIDLSCIPKDTTHGPRCYSGVYLEAVNLAGANLTNANFEGADMPGANLTGAVLHRTNLAAVDLTNAQVANAQMTHTLFAEASVEGVVFDGTDLGDATFLFTHLSAADFTHARNLDTAEFIDAWAWDDRPPLGLPDGTVRLCDARERQELHYERRFSAPRSCARLNK